MINLKLTKFQAFLITRALQGAIERDMFIEIECQILIDVAEQIDNELDRIISEENNA